MCSDRILLDKISSFFNLGEVEEIARLGGVANDNYSIRTTSGNYVVKLVREHSSDNLKTIDPIFRILEKHKFPAAYYLKNPTGKFVFDDGNITAVVMHEESGVVPDLNNNTVYKMGETLARLHSVSAKGLTPRLTWFNPNFVPQGLVDLKSSLDSKFLNRLQNARENIGIIEKPGLRKSILHGDFHPGNVIFYEDELSSVLDWEEATYGYSLLDIAYSIFIIFFKESKFDPALYSCFMEGYQSVQPLTDVEQHNLPGFVRLAGLTVAVWIHLRYGSSLTDSTIDELANRYWAADLDNWSIPSTSSDN